jgi:hypothetical protein
VDRIEAAERRGSGGGGEQTDLVVDLNQADGRNDRIDRGFRCAESPPRTPELDLADDTRRLTRPPSKLLA